MTELKLFLNVVHIDPEKRKTKVTSFFFMQTQTSCRMCSYALFVHHDVCTCDLLTWHVCEACPRGCGLLYVLQLPANLSLLFEILTKVCLSLYRICCLMHVVYLGVCGLVFLQVSWDVRVIWQKKLVSTYFFSLCICSNEGKYSASPKATMIIHPSAGCSSSPPFHTARTYKVSSLSII